MMPNHNATYWPVLDGVRGIAFLLVWLSHLNPAAAGGWFAYGWIGVELFFVLSGFLITGVLLQCKAGYNNFWDYYGHFLRNRVLRIFPLYYFFLGLTALVALVFAWPDLMPFFNRVLFYVTYTQNFYSIIWPDAIRIRGLSHLWSLAVEEQFYLIWPLLVWITPIRKLGLLCCSGILLALFLRICWPNFSGMYVFTPMRIDGLMAGSLLAVLPKPVLYRFRRIFGPIASLFLGFAFLGSYLSAAPTALHVYYAYAGYSLLALGFAACIGWFLTKSHGITEAFIQHPFLIWLGKRSYGLYIFHLPVLYYGRQWLYPKLTALGLPFAADITLFTLNILILLLAAASFHYLEQPFLRLKKLKSNSL